MLLSFLGAAHEVTGSCHYLEAKGKKILIDFGLQQGKDEEGDQNIPPFRPSEIDYVFLTHSHIDHSGRIPMLAKHGFKGKIFTTEASYELCKIMLRDSAHIQEFEAEWRNRKGKRAGKTIFEPLYTMENAENILQHFVGCHYHEPVLVCEGITIEFIDAGHLLGSSSIVITLCENSQTKKVVFSGDIGNINQPLIKDPEYIEQADYIVIESTYGDREHFGFVDYTEDLAGIIQRTFDRGGNVVIPAFAVGRTQEILYFLREIISKDMIKGHQGFPVYIDSPLANEATRVFKENIFGYFDEEAMALLQKGINPISFVGLKQSLSSDDSKAINFETKPAVIISASGMCEAGRIKHHLKHNLWRAESTIVFVGYQANGTLGRAIIEGASSVKLFGEEIHVKAEICKLQGISGHADVNGLLRWMNAFKEKPKRVFVVHGEATVTEKFTERLNKEYGFQAVAPNEGAQYDLLSNTCILQGTPKVVKVKSAINIEPSKKIAVYEALCQAGKRLLRIIEKNKQGSNNDLKIFTEEVDRVADKWDRE